MIAPGTPAGVPDLEATCTASAGVVVAPLLDGGLAHDPVTGRAHLLDRTAAWLVDRATAGPVALGTLVDDAAEATGTDPDVVAMDLAAGIEALRGLGLLDREGDHQPPTPPTGSRRTALAGWSHGAVHAVLDHGIAFRGPDAELIAEVDAFLAGALDDRPATTWIDLEPEPGGSIVLTSTDEWRFPSRDGLFAQLPGVVNEHAARSHDRAVLHAGAVRTPRGEVLLVPGAVDAGKSTLIGALVRSGCDYLGDESIAVRPGTLDLIAYPKPLTLDATSRSVLGLPPSADPHLAVDALRSDVVRLAGDVGPLDAVVLAEYVGPRPTHPDGRGDTTDATRLDPTAAARALLTNCLNLERAGRVGLEDLCRVAESVPVIRIRHRGSVDLAEEIVARGVAGIAEITDGDRDAPADPGG